jgi:putative NADPH-quinone reductase
MSKVAIIVGHVREGSLCEALGEAYRDGATTSGHEASLFVTSRMHFDPILHEGFERVQPLEPDLQKAADAIAAANHLVIIFPLWLGAFPAILKGFLDRVFQPDLVAGSKDKKFPKLLRGKSVRVIITMGMPGFIYRWYYGAHALRLLKRNILAFLGAGPVRTTIHGMVDGVSHDTRKRWLAEAEVMGQNLS